MFDYVVLFKSGEIEEIVHPVERVGIHRDASSAALVDALRVVYPGARQCIIGRSIGPNRKERHLMFGGRMTERGSRLDADEVEGAAPSVVY